jgi:hypothetical protein
MLFYRGFVMLPADDADAPVRVHQPGDERCGVGGPPKPGHPRYRCCRCGLWYHWTGSLWRPRRPSQRWLRKHGLGDGFADFVGLGEHGEPGSPFGVFSATAGRWRYLLRSMLHR